MDYKKNLGVVKRLGFKWLGLSFGPRADFENDAGFLKELDTCKATKFTEGVDYSGATEYAKLEYAGILAAVANIDKKAEWCFEVSVVAASGVIAFGNQTGLSGACCVPALTALLYSMWMSLRARLPAARSSTFPSRIAVDIINDSDMR